MVSAEAPGGAIRPEAQGLPGTVAFDSSEAATATREMEEARAGWVRFYARDLARFGALYHLVVIGFVVGRGATWYDTTIFGLWLGLVALLGARVSTRVLGQYVVAALTVVSLLSLHAQGFLGIAGVLICTLPLCAAVFTGRKGAAISGFAILSAYALFAYGHVSGRVDASARVLRSTDPAAWLWVATAFLVVTASTVALLGKVVDDLDGAARRFMLAKERLEHEERSRVLAERARDAALSARERSRDIEALGLVAGSALHDINNMAMVLGSWAELLEMEPNLPGEATQATQGIRTACRKLGTLGRDVLGLGRGQPTSTPLLRLSEALPAAADVLRRALPEDVSLRIRVEEPLPEVAMHRADLIHVLLEALASLAPRAREGSVLVVTAMPDENAGPGAPLAKLTVRHVAEPPGPGSAPAAEEEDLLTTDHVRIVQRWHDADALELSLYPAPVEEPSP